MTDTVRLSDVLSQSVIIEWYEAVALVSAVADRVRDSFGGHSVPELHQIHIAVDGQISISGAEKTTEPVHRLGQLLQAALTQSDPPVQLRLMVSQATAPEPAFGTVRQFIEALAYFERPDRAAVLRGLHERSAQAPPAADHVTPTLDTIAPIRTETPAPRGRRPEPVSKLKALLLITAAVLVIAAATAYWQVAETRADTRKVADIARKASDVVGTALVAGLSSVSERVGLGRLASSDASGAVAPAKPAVAATSVRLSAGRRVTAVRPSEILPLQAFDLDFAAASNGGPLVSAPVAFASSLPRPIVESQVTIDATVYSAADSTVEPPIGVRPQLPRVLPTTVNKDQLGQIELLILPDGTVGEVKLVGAPRSIRDSMFLSAAKAWQFTPALKDGLPVTYRKLVWLVLQ